MCLAAQPQPRAPVLPVLPVVLCHAWGSAGCWVLLALAPAVGVPFPIPVAAAVADGVAAPYITEAAKAVRKIWSGSCSAAAARKAGSMGYLKRTGARSSWKTRTGFLPQ